jgi:hypothetical protein
MGYIISSAPYLCPFVLLAYPLAVLAARLIRMSNISHIIIGAAVLSLSAVDFVHDAFGALLMILPFASTPVTDYLTSAIPLVTPTVIFGMILLGFTNHEPPTERGGD